MALSEGNKSAEPPRKRVKSEPASDSDSVDLERTILEPPARITDVESSLGPVRTDQESIDEYESSQVAQNETEGTNGSGQRARYQSSIYVDAFNLTLETVLEEESHLFNEPERALLKHWKCLGYEAQYL
jgi:Fanconi-associated nuclease 1